MSNKNSRIFSVLQQIGRSFFLPISILPVAGLLLGLGASFSNYGVFEQFAAGKAELNVFMQGLYYALVMMSAVGKAVFDNLPIMFAMAIPIGMVKEEKAVAVLASVLAYIVMHVTIGKMMLFGGWIDAGGAILSETVTPQMLAVSLGIQTLQMGVFGGIIVGIMVSVLHNRFYRIELPAVLSFFGGLRFVPIVCTFFGILLGVAFFYLWPFVQQLMMMAGVLVTKAGYFGTFVYGFIYRILIPFGLHHVFYMPFWVTELGGCHTMIEGGKVVCGAMNIFYSQLASTEVFAPQVSGFLAGGYSFMLGGLPGAALAMYHMAKSAKKKIVGGLLLSAAVTSMLTGITEPIEFTFLFVAPFLFVVHAVFAGLSYMLTYILHIAIGTTFSCGLIDFTLYGIVPGNARTNWLMELPLIAAYFVAYYVIFVFAIKKWNLQTPGREPDDQDTKLFSQADYAARKAASEGDACAVRDSHSELIVNGLGGADNVDGEVGCCATRLRLNVHDPKKVNEGLLKRSGAMAVIVKGHGVQIVYGPKVTAIKPKVDEHIKSVKK